MRFFIDPGSLSGPSLEWLTTLFNASLKGTIVLTAAGMLSILLRRASAATRHLLWSLGIMGLLALFLVSPLLNVWQLPVLPAALTLTGPAAPPKVSESALIDVIKKQSESTIAQQDLQSFVSPVWPLLMLVVWLAGAVMMLAWLLGGVITLRGIARHAVIAQDERLDAFKELLCGQLRLPRHVTLLQSERAVTPITWGWLRPVVMLPLEATSWPVERQKVVLLHELAHIKRRDCLTQMLAHIACAFFWFNPLVWLAARQLRKERELACDDCVLAMGAKASDYAGHLLEIARSFQSAPRSSVASVAMAHQSEVESRIRAILNPHARRRVFANPTAVAIVLAMTLIVLPLGVIRPVVASQAADAWLADLKDRDPDTREAAARWLGFIGDDAVVPALTAALKDEESQVRECAARSLGFRRAAEGLEPLIAALGDEDSQVREASAWALGRIGDRRAVEPLTAALRDDDDQVREHAALALGAINPP